MVWTRNATRAAIGTAAALIAVLVLASCDDDDDGDGDGMGYCTVHGVVNDSGTVVTGQGFSVSHLGAGGYRVTFDVPFATQPTVTLTTIWDDSHRNAVANLYAPAVDQFDVRIADTDYPSTMLDRGFHFTAIGVR